MIVGDLPADDLARRLRSNGLRVRTGPIVNRIQSRLPRVAQGVALHYAEHPLEDPDGFADFHVRLASPRSVRRWLRPQAVFQFDGGRPFLPLPANQAFAMLEWGLNWCVSSHCHQYLIVHAAAVEKNGAALVLPGPPGSLSQFARSKAPQKACHCSSPTMVTKSFEPSLVSNRS